MTSNKSGWYEKYEPEWQKQVGEGVEENCGKVTWNEFQKALSAFGVDANEASSQFERLDVDGDGVISRKEYNDFVRQFNWS
ncbi:uncharacterized protein N7469_002221 [Penicillium citrinum]|uniref:EF-hand domain-containing protein n=1 Tax=Penicillium citrinum TaxID=5077 RepID=A0A9W9PA84_PENCI|nr:uncharacterized protein N7469_002221 [Penicillium citrinum]KAJ5240630.1 hypothetical protein N7469_002221 [Penicillium citrinum]